jgi:hypothetical protein
VSEWLAVVLAGTLGGAMSTLLPAGTEFLWPKLLQNALGMGLSSFIAHLLRNTMLGALAGFVVWGLANPGTSFDANSVPVGEVAAGIIVGGGGVSALHSLFQQSRRLESKDESLELAEELMTADEDPK